MMSSKFSTKVQSKLREYYYQTQEYLLDSSLLSSQQEYQKFVIICNIRTGSTMLSSILASHPQAICFFELFHRHLESVPFSVPGYQRKSKNLKIVALRNSNPVEFLRSEIYKPQKREIQAVGFKLLYPQARKGDPWWNSSEFDRWWEKVGYEPDWNHAKSDLWQFLREEPSVSIIHLKRKNLLRSKVSATIAQTTGKWGVGATGGIAIDGSPPRISIDFDECLQDFEAHRRMEDETDEFFDGKSKLNVTYEELVHDPLKTTRKVQEFLGINPLPLVSKTRKQITSPLEKIVSNYSELKVKFTNTPWQSFFDS